MRDLSTTQVNKLGERLRVESSNNDLQLLNEYRATFNTASDHVMAVVRDTLRVNATGRSKTTMSIVSKLRREKTRLSRMQDIAGCRTVVEDMHEQDLAVSELLAVFPDAQVIDRREHPSHGYRAVHVIVKCDGKLVEVQIRTSLQHLWAEISEKASDVMDPRIKYGEGDESALEVLQRTSQVIADLELGQSRLRQMRSTKGFARQYKHRLRHFSQQFNKLEQDMIRELSELLQRLTEIERETRDLPHSI